MIVRLLRAVKPGLRPRRAKLGPGARRGRSLGGCGSRICNGARAGAGAEEGA